MNPLYLAGSGLVTCAGLTHAQSVNSFLAGISGFSEEVAFDQLEMQIMAPVPAEWQLKTSSSQWLLNMAARAGLEAMEQAKAKPSRTLLVCAGPEAFRMHECWDDADPDKFLADLQELLGGPFVAGSRMLEGGAAELMGVLPELSQVLSQKPVDYVLLIGVDSLINEADLGRLRVATRLQGDSAQGVVPGEGAGAVVFSLTPVPGLALRSVGLAKEADPVTGDRQSQGRGMQDALKSACSAPGCPEQDVVFIVSNGNGERYAAMELLIFRARFYRTHREYMATAYPAMSFGETGAAGCAVSISVAADAFRRGYAPGAHAMLEISSENGLRAAAFVSQAQA